MELRKRDLSLTRASKILFGTTHPFNQSCSENFLDDLWDRGLVINLGEPNQYKYRITDAGKNYESHTQ